MAVRKLPRGCGYGLLWHEFPATVQHYRHSEGGVSRRARDTLLQTAACQQSFQKYAYC